MSEDQQAPSVPQEATNDQQSSPAEARPVGPPDLATGIQTQRDREQRASEAEIQDSDYPDDERIEHVVVPNDTHVALAMTYYGNPSRVKEIADRYPVLQVGDTLHLPPRVPTFARLVREEARKQNLHNPQGEGFHPDLGNPDSPASKRVTDAARQTHRSLIARKREEAAANKKAEQEGRQQTRYW